MSGTALEHPLVLDYMCELDAAMRGLPPEQVRELKDQLAAHLADELAPDAGDPQVVAALSRLGSPADLAAEAGAVRARVPSAPGQVARFLRTVRPRTWIAVALALIAVAVAGKWCDYYLSAGSLQFNYGADWWYPSDVQHQTIVSVNGSGSQFPLVQNTTLIRAGQWQGYVVAVMNNTSVTQTIVGDGAGPAVGWNNPVSEKEQVSVSRTYTDIANGFVGQRVTSGIRFGLPVSIPPGQMRLIRVLWLSDTCPASNGGGSVSNLYLRVRVGWFTRTETIPQQIWQLQWAGGARCR